MANPQTLFATVNHIEADSGIPTKSQTLPVTAQPDDKHVMRPTILELPRRASGELGKC
jgi:hypothetical protein